MNVDVNKKYKTESGLEVKLYREIPGLKEVFGAYKTESGIWILKTWGLDGFSFYGLSLIEDNNCEKYTGE